mmetsp:Transcript_22876/g.71270  ORF Transcript_22876/g.71270 Transcript_22876/m.71270 type:complete len:394 (-) Transcript_22876:60-1241(-)
MSAVRVLRVVDELHYSMLGVVDQRGHAVLRRPGGPAALHGLRESESHCNDAADGNQYAVSGHVGHVELVSSELPPLLAVVLLHEALQPKPCPVELLAVYGRAEDGVKPLGGEEASGVSQQWLADGLEVALLPLPPLVVHRLVRQQAELALVALEVLEELSTPALGVDRQALRASIQARERVPEPRPDADAALLGHRLPEAADRDPPVVRQEERRRVRGEGGHRDEDEEPQPEGHHAAADGHGREGHGAAAEAADRHVHAHEQHAGLGALLKLALRLLPLKGCYQQARHHQHAKAQAPEPGREDAQRLVYDVQDPLVGLCLVAPEIDAFHRHGAGEEPSEQAPLCCVPEVAHAEVNVAQERVVNARGEGAAAEQRAARVGDVAVHHVAQAHAHV